MASRCKLVAYYRVSTKRQEVSGLGLEGQHAAVKAYSERSGCSVLASYQEAESGKVSTRPQLALALAHAKRSKATLVVAKLDRLSRNVAFLSKLMESGVDFVACDNPEANHLTLRSPNGPRQPLPPTRLEAASSGRTISRRKVAPEAKPPAPWQSLDSRPKPTRTWSPLSWRSVLRG